MSRRWIEEIWSGGGGPAGTLARAALLPAEWAFRAASHSFHAAYDAGRRPVHTVPLPVVSVGNLRVGGSGKTPFTRMLVEHALARGHRPAVLHGGYAQDEPALHRHWHPEVPVLVGRDRAESAMAAAGLGCDLAILDDGFQHRRLARDADILLVAAEHVVQRPAHSERSRSTAAPGGRAPVPPNMHLLPRGPWREPLGAARRADLVVVVRKTAHEQCAEAARSRVLAVLEDQQAVPSTARAWLRPAGIERWRPTPDATRAAGGAKPEPRGPDATPPDGEYVAVAGIAEPEPFFEQARQLGAALASVLRYPDHHAYDEGDAARIRREADGRPVLTTEKDAIKLADLIDDLELCVLRQEVVLERGEDTLVRLLARVMGEP